MSADFFAPIIFIVLGISFVALIALGVAAIHDARQTNVGRSSIVRRGYIYLVSFVTLLFIGASFISLFDLGLRTWVFPAADPVLGSYQNPPPSLYLPPKTLDTSGPVTLTCTDGCTLTDQQRSDITLWQDSYKQWQAHEDVSSRRLQSLITPISFLVVALIVFLIHWRLVRRDKSEIEEGNNLTRSTHFTAMAFVWLIVGVVSAGFLVNTLLRIVIPGADLNTAPTRIAVPLGVSMQERDGVEGLVTCGDACGLDATIIGDAKNWQEDYDAWQEQSGNENNRDRQNELAIEIALLLVAIPMFWYHFRTAWREKKKSTSTTTV